MHWISIKDKLPIDGQKVLAANQEKIESTYFHVWDNFSSFGRIMQNATHWMPLPEGPNGMDWHKR